MIERVIRFQCDDGKEFASLEEAETHEERLRIIKELDEFICYGNMTPDDAADYILSNFVRKSK